MSVKKVKQVCATAVKPFATPVYKRGGAGDAIVAAWKVRKIISRLYNTHSHVIIGRNSPNHNENAVVGDLIVIFFLSKSSATPSPRRND